MKLFLVQHGEAVSKEVDPERPLSERGIADVKAMAGALVGVGQMSAIWHSGKRRAEQTAQLLADIMAPQIVPGVLDGLNPNDDVDVIANQVDTWEQDAMLVGHLPFMASLVTRLVGGDVSNPVVAYQPGSVVGLERKDGNWQVCLMVRPEQI